MTSVLADLALESEAAMLTGMRLAQLFEADATDADVALRRLATPVSKYWVCKRGPHHAYEALECLGGNGYTEAFPLARRYREQPVMAIWEGSGNVIALDVLRALTRDPDSAAAFAEESAPPAESPRCWTRTSSAPFRCSVSSPRQTLWTRSPRRDA
jgi:putative acyl-CoA dehydrogenase